MQTFHQNLSCSLCLCLPVLSVNCLYQGSGQSFFVWPCSKQHAHHSFCFGFVSKELLPSIVGGTFSILWGADFVAFFPTWWSWMMQAIFLLWTVFGSVLLSPILDLCYSILFMEILQMFVSMQPMTCNSNDKNCGSLLSPAMKCNWTLELSLQLSKVQSLALQVFDKTVQIIFTPIYWHELCKMQNIAYHDFWCNDFENSSMSILANVHHFPHC